MKMTFSDTRVMTALDMIGSQSLQTETRRDARCFLEEFVNSSLSSVISRPLIGQGKSCFWSGPEGAKLTRAGLSTGHLCRNNGRWSCRLRRAALT